jgi:hypothetical protein
MEFYLPTIDWYLQKATPWVAGKTIQIQYGVQVVQLLTLFQMVVQKQALLD